MVHMTTGVSSHAVAFIASAATTLDLFDLDSGTVPRWGEDVGPDAASPIEKA